MVRWLKLNLPCCLLLLGSGCGVETVVHDLGEKEANDIVVLLADNEITATKTMRDTGREVFYSINVKPGDKLKAMTILKDNDYPRREIQGYGEVFSEGGLIPTAAEEKAKKLRAIEGEIEKQLRLVHGILDVEVNIVIPDESALKTTGETETPTTASVTVKYMPGKDGVKPLSEPQISAVVAAGVEKLTADHVVVVMTPAKAVAAAACPECPAGGAGFLCKIPDRGQKLAVAGVAILFVLLSLLIGFDQMRLRHVRGRLIRLQNEIAKARRKPQESIPAPVE